MSRGTSKSKVVDAVLAGLCGAGDVAMTYAIAESVVRNAQPCRVDVGLELGTGQGKGRPALSHEVRVRGLAGALHATVLTAQDGKPASLTSGLQALKAAARRRAGANPYRMLALPLEGDAVGLAKLRTALERELGSRAAHAEVYSGSPVNVSGRTVIPAVVVIS